VFESCGRFVEQDGLPYDGVEKYNPVVGTTKVGVTVWYCNGIFGCRDSTARATVKVP